MWLSIISDIEMDIIIVKQWDLFIFFFYWPFFGIQIIIIRGTQESLFLQNVLVFVFIMYLWASMQFEGWHYLHDYDGKLIWSNYLFYHIMFTMCILIVLNFLNNLLIRLDELEKKIKNSEFYKNF